MQQQIDSHLNKLTSHGFVEKVVNNSVVSGILNSSSFESVNKTIRPHMGTIMTVLGVLAIIAGILWLLGIIAMLGTLFGWVFAWAFLIIFLFSLIGVLFTLFQGYGMVTKKRWFPSLMLVAFGWSILSLILQELFRWGMVGYRSGNYLFMLIISLIVMLFVLKNRDIFTA